MQHTIATSIRQSVDNIFFIYIVASLLYDDLLVVLYIDTLCRLCNLSTSQVVIVVVNILVLNVADA